MKSEMIELSASMQFLSDGVDGANKLMNKIKQEMAAIRKEKEHLCLCDYRFSISRSMNCGNDCETWNNTTGRTMLRLVEFRLRQRRT